jgi:DNA polymerase III delta prime subunit
MRNIKRAVSVDQLLKKKFIEMPFEGKWEASFGIPERSGVWIIWGNSGNGKTNFALQLARYLATFGKVAYDTLEEGARKSFQIAVRRAKMESVAGNFTILNREHLEDLKVRLRKKKSPQIIIIDSIQYSGLTKSEYIALKEEFDDKLFIFISHAEGKNPKGSLANFTRYDADIKIRIEGYKAFPTSRYGGNEEFVIWHKGASDYWSDID